jgi:predicted RND superfamily exporter protein
MQDMAFIGGQDKVDEKCKLLVGDPDNPTADTFIKELIRTLRENRSSVLQGLSEFQREFAPYFKKNILTMCSTESIALNDLPVTVLDQFSNKERDLFMVTIYPEGSLYEDNRILNKFVDDMDRINAGITGGPPVAVAWMRIAARDGRNAILLTLFIVFALLWIDLGKARYAVLAMIPLILGGFWMVGIMELTGQMLNFMTMMGLPLILGIGIDDGVHIMHRWKAEGPGRLMTVFSSTGKAILLTSLTTMLAFGSMIFSVFPAWAYFGLSLVIGVGTCFLTSVIVLSGVLGWIERNNTHLNKLRSNFVNKDD